MWGSVAIAQHAARKALGQNLWQQPSMREVLELLDPNKLHQSAIKFPLQRKLTEVKSFFFFGSCQDKNHKSQLQNNVDIYESLILNQNSSTVPLYVTPTPKNSPKNLKQFKIGVHALY